MSTYRPAFVAALALPAEAFTGGAVASGDFDVLTAAQAELEDALIRRGFEGPNQPGMLLRGLHHLDLGIGFEVVSGQLFDGAADRNRTRVVPIDAGAVRFPAVEDMIADRMGQFTAPYAGEAEMLGQAIVLCRIACHNLEDPLDAQYLDQRIQHETAGSCAIFAI